MKEKKYRVFDRKDKYQQTYSPELEGGLDWAIQCAAHTQGRVDEVTFENGEVISSKTIYPNNKGK
jgi:hypothetical protein